MDELGDGIRRVTLPLPTRPGHVHTYLLPGDEGWTLVDTGIGVPDAKESWALELAQAGGRVATVFVTHFHPDHWGELPMLVYALKYTTEPPRREPFVILGPPGVVQLLRRLAEGYGDWLLDPGFPIGILDVRDGEPFPLNADVNLETFPVPHTDESVAVSLVAPEGRLVYTGDTGPSSELARCATGCDLLLAECSLPEAAQSSGADPCFIKR